MSELRDLVIDAHGGIVRWNKVKTIEGDMPITGGVFHDRAVAFCAPSLHLH